ncbi:MAG TPA: FtsX-like permease family protein [Candidatus Saccharimonadales bacterium]
MTKPSKASPSVRRASIPLKTLMYIAWRNLVHKKLRASLTILGVVIGIGAIYFLLSFGIGLQRLVTNEVIGNQSLKSIEVSTPNSKIIKLDNDIYQKIKNLAHVVRIGASYSYAGSLKVQGSEIDAIVYGVDDSYQKMDNLVASKGRLLRDDDTDSMVINHIALQAIGIKEDSKAIGKKVTVRIPLLNANPESKAESPQAEILKDFTIVGVTGSGSGSEIFITNHVFQLAGRNTYGNIKLEVDDSQNVPVLRKQIESLGYQTTSPNDTVDQINQIFKFFNFVLVGFGAIGMIVAVLGMFNTLTISLLERTKEIGLMMALGARDKDMRKLFIFEAVLLSVIGAAIGIIMAVFGGLVVTLVMNGFARGRGVTDSFALFANPPILILGTLGFMLLVGLAVVYFPAKRAEHINPIDALRRE